VTKRSDLAVDLRPGRAIVRDPEQSFTVEIRYSWDNRDRRARATDVCICGNIPGRPNLRPYLDAVTHTIRSEPVAARLRAPKRRPLPGRPPDRVFYLQVIALHNRFLVDGSGNPSAATARLMGVPPALVRTWIHRGRRYLEQER
jgi:hypothetical protein